MNRRNAAFIVLFVAAVTSAMTYAQQCSKPPARVALDVISDKSLVSPDRSWRFLATVSGTEDRDIFLYIKNEHSRRKTKVGVMNRSGDAFWSNDSKRLLVRDAHAAQDVKIRVFDVTGAIPKEIAGVDDALRRAIATRIPPKMETLWLYYPKACFAEGDSSTVLLLADAPLVKQTGGPGKDNQLRLRLDLNSIEATVLKRESRPT